MEKTFFTFALLSWIVSVASLLISLTALHAAKSADWYAKELLKIHHNDMHNIIQQMLALTEEDDDEGRTHQCDADN
jgi:hypothetical protein